MRFVGTHPREVTLVLALLLAACGADTPAPPSNAPEPPVATPSPVSSASVELASMPAPAFLENLWVTPAGDILFTHYLGRTIERLDAAGQRTTFATLDVHPVSLVPLDGGYLVAAHGASFTDGPAFLGTGQLLFVDGSGAVTDALPLTDAGFANGMLVLPNGTVLIADSAKAQILSFDRATRSVRVWFADPALAPQADPFLPGANGLKLQGDSVVVSSSAGRSLHRLALAADGSPQGALQTIVSGLPGADDFVVLPDGGFVVATHGRSVARVSADGRVSTLTEDTRVRGNTAVALTGAGESRRLVVLGTGGLSEGGRDPGVVLSVALPE
jgi:sugar lactone lactonase YvrE